jgi:acyl-CoA synthetase (AMP-forming)/AMP-acid ligase II
MPDLIPLADLLATGRAEHHPFSIVDGRRCTWGSFASRTAAIADHLARHRETRWALSCSDPVQFAQALFAAWHAGKTPVILPNFQPGTLAALKSEFDAVIDDGMAMTVPESSFAFSRMDPNRTLLDTGVDDVGGNFAGAPHDI